MDDQQAPAPQEENENITKEKAPPPRPQFNLLAKIIGRDVHWLVQYFVLALCGALIAFGATLYNGRCENFPIAFTQVRDATCQPPSPFPPQDFVIVSSKLLGSGDVSSTTVDSVSLGIEAELQRSDLPQSLGVLELVESSNSWIDAGSTLDDMKDIVRNQANLFNADIVIYGQVLQSQDVVFEPAFYIHEPASQSILSLVEGIDTEALGVQLPILEGRSLQVSDWVGGLRGLAVGLQFSRQSNQLANDPENVTERLQKLDLALQSFASVPDTVQSDFYAITNLYAGNTALQLAVLEQLQYEQSSDNCVSGICLSYENALFERYLTAWEHYTLALQSGRDDLVIRSLIGRGNVHYHLALLTRTQEDESGADFINYDCYTGENLFFVENDFIESDVSWLQRGLAAQECYEQVIQAGQEASIIQVKGLFGAGRTVQWLGGETETESYLLNGFEYYTTMIEQFESASDDERDDNERLCLSGYAYGERAQIRWASSDSSIRVLPDLLADLETAIDLLENAPLACDAGDIIEKYELDLEILGG